MHGHDLYELLIPPRQQRRALGNEQSLQRSGPRLLLRSLGGRGPGVGDRGPALAPNNSRVDEHKPSSLRIAQDRSEEHTSELQSRRDIVCRLLLEKKKK